MPHLRILFAIAILAFTSCGKSDALQITGVLNICASIAHRAGTTSNSPGGQARYIATEFRKVDTSSCPADFRMAYQAHALAWQQAVAAIETKDFSSGLSGVANSQASEAETQINTTYNDLTQIAARYGAIIPFSVAGQ